MRTIQGLLEMYKQKHPQEGFPAVMPWLEPNWHAERFYKFEYAAIRPDKSGPAEGYILKATSLNNRCFGHLISYMTSADRLIHMTIEDRPATKADGVLPL